MALKYFNKHTLINDALTVGPEALYTQLKLLSASLRSFLTTLSEIAPCICCFEVPVSFWKGIEDSRKKSIYILKAFCLTLFKRIHEKKMK